MKADRRQPVARGTAAGVPRAAVEDGLAPQLKQTKLDLLPILYELLRSKSVTRAARALGITQPAVSQALRRLRAMFGDDLLVAFGRDLQPTDRALALLPQLEATLAEIGALLRPATPFDPLTEELRVVIMTADYVSLLLAPILAEICAREAPRIVFEFVSGGARSVDDLAGVDFLIAPRAFGHTLGKRIGAMPLWRDEVVCLAAARNTEIPPSITPQAFRRLRQVAYQMNPSVPEKVRMLLQPTSVLETRRVCALPDFLVLGAVVDQADCVALVPRKVADELVRWRELRIVELAYADKHLAIDAYWTQPAGSKRGHAWCRTLLAHAARRIAARDEGSDGAGDRAACAGMAVVESGDGRGG
jgi:LysR family transcriptional regulator, nod-box dependent transcriptional activator